MRWSKLVWSSGLSAIIAAVGVVLVIPDTARAASTSPPASKPVPFMPEPMTDNDSGFQSIFDGQTLKGWEGDPTYWRVENGNIVGETTQATLLTDHNSFVIWQGGLTGDFELKLQYRITRMGNSGINYRSEELSDPKWTMRGYQFDIDGTDWGKGFAADMKKRGIQVPAGPNGGGMVDPGESLRVTGQNYEERGRQILALPGEITHAAEQERKPVTGYLGGATLVDDVATDGWNDVHIIARGNVLIHILNRHLMSLVVDDDNEHRHMQGKLGLQVHVGPPMKVEYRNIRLKPL